LPKDKFLDLRQNLGCEQPIQDFQSFIGSHKWGDRLK
jgi:hypothetical protein